MRRELLSEKLAVRPRRGSPGPANITWRQEVGGSAIEASKIAGHATVSMTGDYTGVQLKRQDELTRRIQQRLDKARAKIVEIKRTGAAA